MILCMKFSLIAYILFLASTHQSVESTSLFNLHRRTHFMHLLSSSGPSNHSKNVIESYFNQELDHFDESNNLTWKQRYWVNENYFSGSGPVFLMIGGESAANANTMGKGQWIKFASKLKALCVMLEHRFYGKSWPTNDMSTINLRYLSSEQALADLALFRNFIHSKYNLTDHNKWIAFGGSYSGSLAAWLRLKYPHLIHATVSSSGPLLALVDFSAYLDVVNRSLAFYSPDCPVQVEIAMKLIQEMLRSDDGRVELRKRFKICEPLADDDDIINFNSMIIGYFQETVQYNRFGSTFGITQVCKIMQNSSMSDHVQRVAEVNDRFLAATKQTCLDASNKKWLDSLRNVTWNETAVAYRQWTYQSCTEFGFFQSTGSNRQPFGKTLPINFFTKQCEDIFGVKFDSGLLTRAVEDTNRKYGELKYAGSRVVFVNGNIDPWHALGITKKPPNPFTQVIFINGTSHCADMTDDMAYDTKELRSARDKIFGIVSKWLNE